jgi:hypothetical protein
MIMSKLLPACLALALALAAPPTVRAATGAADILFVNGKVVTVDEDFSIRSAVAVKDGRILAVGGDELQRAYTARQVIDLGGRVLMPGFIDTHIHIIGYAKRAIDLTEARSITEVQALVRKKAQELGPGEWITGQGWDEALLSERRNLLKQDLDAATGSNPVILVRAGGHSAVSNSLALKLAGIDRNTPDPERGVIERDAAGEPNGIIRERQDLVTRLAPAPTAEEMRPSYTAALKALLPLGITSIMEAATSIDDEPVDKGGVAQPTRTLTYANFRAIYRDAGRDLPRATLYITYPGRERLQAFPYRTGHGDDRLKLGPIGEMPGADGGFTGPTAWTLEDYKSMPGFRGKASLTPENMREMVQTSRELGWQLGTHAIGDAAIQALVDAYAVELRTNPKRDHRWFTAHFTMLPPDRTLQLMRTFDIYAAAQPNFLYNLEGRYNQTLDGKRLQHNNPVAVPQRAQVKVVFGSDNLPIGPMVGLYAAITRRGQSGDVYGAEEAVSREAAIRAYTRDAAYLAWDEAKKGSIEAGKFADLIVLDRDILTAPEAEILETKVDLTMIDGRIVYARGTP